MDNLTTTKQLLYQAKNAKKLMSRASLDDINRALIFMAESLIDSAEDILSANALDIEAAKENIGEVMLDRLRLDKKRIEAMADGIIAISKLPSPLNCTIEHIERPNGLSIDKVCVPLGVVAIIYESRPNVTSDAAALAIKSGNVCVLRSGKEAHLCAKAITAALRRGLKKAGICEDAVQLVEDTDRKSAMELMTAEGYVDLLIPRGGKGLIRACVENATVPCIETGTGICHVYADKCCDIDMALNIIENAKTSRPSVCNAMEVLLVHRDIAKELLPRLKDRLVDKRKAMGLVPVELRLDSEAIGIVDGTALSDGDFDTEFLDYILAVGIVGSADEAISHISTHSTRHSECIITLDQKAASDFVRDVDAAAVYVNASTRFTDGGEFGLGCEMGISTQKLHARGPMGIKELTTYKYVVRGNGQIR